MNTFWSNTIWFLLLGLLTFVILVISFKKTEKLKLSVALYFIVSGITFSIEATIFLFLKAYDYYPMIIPNSLINDGLAGNLFSQFLIAAVALFAAVFHLKKYWYFVFSAGFGLIEELFLYLGIYKQYWYHTWMTVLGFPVIFLIAHKLYDGTLLYKTKPKRYFFMSYGLYAFHMPFVFWPLILAGIVKLNTHLFLDAKSSFAFVALLNLYFLIVVCMYSYFFKLKWYLKAGITAALYGAIFLAQKGNLFFIKEGWFFFFSTVDIFAMYLAIVVLDRLLPKVAYSK